MVNENTFEDDLPFTFQDEGELQDVDPGYAEDAEAERRSIEQQIMEEENRKPVEGKVLHLKLSSNFQCVELDVRLPMNEGEELAINTAIALVNDVGSRVLNDDKNPQKPTKRQVQAAAATSQKGLVAGGRYFEPELATDRQIEALYRCMGGQRSTYAKWTKEHASGVLSTLKERGLFVEKR